MWAQFATTVLVVCALRINTKAADDDNTIVVLDGHNDLPDNLHRILQNNVTAFNFLEDLSNDPVWGLNSCKSCHTDYIRMRKGGIGAQFWAAYVSCESQHRDAVARTFEQIDVIKRLVAKYPEQLLLVRTTKEIRYARQIGRIASLIGVEGGHSIDSKLALLRIYYDVGVRYMTLTHLCNTPWADSSIVDIKHKPNRGITRFGEIVVKEMNRIGMMVDISHVSSEVMRRVIEISMAPVIFSHSSSFEIFHHHRNAPDDVLRKLKANGGIVMINFFAIGMHKDPKAATLYDVINHINHIVNLIGVDHVGLGADYDGVSRQPAGLHDVSRYPILFAALQKSNATLWTLENLRKLGMENFMRVFEAVENVKESLAHLPPHEEWIPEDALTSLPKHQKELVLTCHSEFHNT